MSQPAERRSQKENGNGIALIGLALLSIATTVLIAWILIENAANT